MMLCLYQGCVPNLYATAGGLSYCWQDTPLLRIANPFQDKAWLSIGDAGALDLNFGFKQFEEDLWNSLT